MVARGSPPPRWHVVGILILGVMTVSTAAVLIRLAMAAAGTRGVGLSLMLAVLRVAIASILFLPGWRSLDLARLQPSALVFSIGAGLCLALHFGAW
ncbi:MAG: EamA family transporter, partial [Cyanobacteria bacterium J06639_1]